MFEKILVPLDGSALAACVLPHVVAIAQAMGSNITLLRVIESHDGPTRAVNPVDWQLHKIEVQTYLNALGTQLGQCLERLPSLQMVEGLAAEHIIEYAQRHDFDLLVLSSHGQGGLSGWNVSSVVQKVIHRAHKSILLVRAYQPCSEYTEGDWCAFRYRRILVLLDGSQRAEYALSVATTLAQHDEAQLLLAHVVARPAMIQRMPITAEDRALLEQITERNQALATKYLEDLQAHLSPTPQLYIQVHDNVATTLHRLVEQQAADLVILCAHGSSGQQLWPYGNVATSFITYGTTPLLVMQDLPQHEISRSKAELISEDMQRRLHLAHEDWEAECMNANVAI